MNLSIVPSSEEHAELFLNWRNQKSSLAHNPLMPLELEDCKERLKAESSDLQQIWSVNSFRWFFSQNSELVSNFSLKEINKMMLTAEIGYGVGESFQGQGIGTATVQLMVNKIFHETNLRKLIAFVHDKNIASCKILEKVGFVKEGLLREHYLINDEPANEVCFGLLKKDWKS